MLLPVPRNAMTAVSDHLLLPLDLSNATCVLKVGSKTKPDKPNAWLAHWVRSMTKPVPPAVAPVPLDNLATPLVKRHAVIALWVLFKTKWDKAVVKPVQQAQRLTSPVQPVAVLVLPEHLLRLRA